MPPSSYGTTVVTFPSARPLLGGLVICTGRTLWPPVTFDDQYLFQMVRGLVTLHTWRAAHRLFTLPIAIFISEDAVDYLLKRLPSLVRPGKGPFKVIGESREGERGGSWPNIMPLGPDSLGNFPDVIQSIPHTHTMAGSQSERQPSPDA